ncbi:MULTISPECIES: hypothetical protein [unclassified Paenibacillus]|uniref:hypothetical protein n=1 Tax=unclassified Paenibacillus TaxID=185978 RepID=UPI001042A0B2|nr:MULTISPECIES: hypothetical protein [unclassified Paenibacillus]NIK68858.1 hypothetical protein [Paenibacillus sp. BK720]TCM98869.1 hypothetical protein EV294_102154 [Paenibacillus sp. BK033]
MFKNRSFVAGLGVGIIAGAILLQLMQIGDESQRKLSDGFNDGEPKLYTQAQLDEKLAEERAKASQNAMETANPEAEKPEESPAVKAPEPPADSSKNDDKKEAAAEKPAEEVVKRQLRITGGMNLTDTAELLAGQKLISDKAAFIKAMKNKPVRAGYFIFEGNPTVTDIIRILTSKPLTKSEFEQKMKG